MAETPSPAAAGRATLPPAEEAPGSAGPRSVNPFASFAGAVLMLALDAFLLALGVGGMHALFRHDRALALLLAWAAGYAALAALRTPRAPRSGRRDLDPPPVFATLVLVPLVTPLLSAWAERAGLAPLPGGPVLRWAGVLLAAAGFLLRILAMQRLGPRFAPVVERRPEHGLETGGVYARLRHPGYAGAWLANLGAILAFGSAATLPLALLLAWATWVRVAREERALETTFGDEYRAWRAVTGRFWPHRAR